MKYHLLFFIFFITNFTQAQDYRPSLLFREDFKETPPEIPVSQKHIANADVIFSTYGPGQDSLKKSNHEKPINDPYYMWSGLCLDSWAVTFKHKDAYANLSSFAKIKWRSKQAGFHSLRIVLKLADGQWLISDQLDGPSNDWRIKEFIISDINWWLLDIVTIKETKPVPKDKLDLSKVDEIGVTDLMRGGGSNACSRLDWIEVYGNSVSRK
jgi:hypothetical protein